MQTNVETKMENTKMELDDLHALLEADPTDADRKSNKRKAIPFRELTSNLTCCSKCFACLYISKDSMKKTPEYSAMIRLYTENATSQSRAAIFSNVKDYFDKYIKPNLMPGVDWTVDMIREHFTKHTNYPTDEILTQLDNMSTYRNILESQIAYRDESGLRVDVKELKALVELQREIRLVRMQKNELPHMIGYDETLKW